MKLSGKHRIHYTYDSPIELGLHFLKIVPQENHNQRVDEFNLKISPEPDGVEPITDEENNEIISFWFSGEHRELEIICSWKVSTKTENPFKFLLSRVKDESETNPLLIPFMKTTANPLSQTLVNHICGDESDSIEIVSKINSWISSTISTETRTEENFQSIVQTVKKQSGACRDLSVLMIKFCRLKGIPARYVSGYCFNEDPNIAHELHAWVEVWLPHGGWRGFDPTLGIAVSDQHIIINTSINPQNTQPLTGGYYGEANSKLDYFVDITKQ